MLLQGLSSGAAEITLVIHSKIIPRLYEALSKDLKVAV